MQVYEGRRIPLNHWDTTGEDYRRLRFSSRPIRFLQHRQLDRPASPGLTKHFTL
jgi:hypothetical protein